MAARTSRERPEKILVAMHELSGGKIGFLKYEDIVVKAFELFPDEFALRGHPQFPDSSDVHKPLYGPLKRRGLVRAADKRFSLTLRGVEVASRLLGRKAKPSNGRANPDRLDRALEDEVERMVKSEAFKFFLAGQREKILDTDFFAFLGCTVRTVYANPNGFLGRIKTAQDAIADAYKLGKPTPATAKALAETMAYLEDRFRAEINWKAKPHGEKK